MLVDILLGLIVGTVQGITSVCLATSVLPPNLAVSCQNFNNFANSNSAQHTCTQSFTCWNSALYNLRTVQFFVLSLIAEQLLGN